MALKPTNSFLHRPMTYLPLSFIALLLLVSNTPPLISAAKSGEYAKPVPRHSHPMKEKLTQFKIYWHDIQSGPNPTSVNIIKPPAANTSSAASGFGWTNMIDNPLTEAPDMKSKLVGRAQGFYSMASQSEIGLIMAMNFAFMEGKYNGSSITILGRNLVMDKSREMPIVGGTGLFRFARGYVELRTHSFDLKTGNACVEYNCYVMHY